MGYHVTRTRLGFRNNLGSTESKGFALPTVMIASIVMLAVLLVSVSSNVAIRVSLSSQYYNQLAKNAGDAGAAYAKACLDANSNVPLWSDAKPLGPNTDCSGNQLAGFTCPTGSVDTRCSVTVNGGATAQVLVVGGGGGGGSAQLNAYAGGGGGGGGVIYNSSYTLNSQAYSVTVGGGGAANVKGSDSIFGTITATGGGSGTGTTNNTPNNNGGSGGGGIYITPSSGYPTGLGNTPATSPSQGNNGGTPSNNTGASNYGSAGGGGAGGIGIAYDSRSFGGAGGPGLSNSISGSSVPYAGGGGGGVYSSNPGSGGSGGGGAGGGPGIAGVAGAANTGGGGGGGGASTATGGSGGSGVVIISYPTSSITATVTGAVTTSTPGSNTIQKFTGNGTFNVTSAGSGAITSTFSVGLPTLVNGKASNVSSIGSTKLLKSSTGTVWRQYSQSSSLTILATATSTFVGSGADGAITVAAGKNLNTDTLATGRTCADAVNYSVTTLTANTATLSTTPAAGCFITGDEVLLINLQGISTNYANVGNNETLRIQSISTNTITFTGNKVNYYGNGASDDTNLGTATTNQRVMLQRVPNYTNVTVNSGITLAANAWDGIKGGVLFFRANGVVSVAGTVDMRVKGYRYGVYGYDISYPTILSGAQGEGIVSGQALVPGSNYGGGGGGGPGNPCDGRNSGGGGGGGGYAVVGTAGVTGGNFNCGAGAGGAGGGPAFGISNLGQLFMGSGGAGGGGSVNAAGGNGGNGGGIVYITGNTITVSGSINSNGQTGSAGSPADGAGGAGGGGSGGSIYIKASTSVTVGTSLVTANGSAGGAGGVGSWTSGGNGGSGGNGRIVISATTISGTTSPTAN